jgi:hypothetical protein
VDRQMLEVWRRAEAMGLVRARPADLSGLPAVRLLAEALGKAGLATSVTAALKTPGSVSAAKQLAMRRVRIDALETSPLPTHEWTGAATTLLDDELASLLNVSSSSLARYRSGERDTPDVVAARLHFLTLLIADLSGSYNEVGIRRWFQRPRTPLGGSPPRDWLNDDWQPDQPRPAAVRQLARDLVFLSGT